VAMAYKRSSHERVYKEQRGSSHDGDGKLELSQRLRGSALSLGTMVRKYRGG